MDNPFIHLIKTNFGFYLFDVNKNTIQKISKEAYDYLQKQSASEETEGVPDEILQLKQSGYLSTKRPEKIEMQETHLMHYYLSNRLEKLTLQVTQQCNFCCSYCPYTLGDDTHYHSHNPNHMTWETAKKAIDFFALRTRDTPMINIGFYGGEPLLEYNLIKKCISYASKVFEGRNITYSMTTNGSLLTPENVKFLIDSGVSVTVSFDGPREIQNKNRKSKANGEGTFDTVTRKLTEIRDNEPGYYKKLSFNTVIDPANDSSCINEFFSCETYRDLSVSTPMVDPFNQRRLYYSDKFIDTYKLDTVAAMLANAGLIEPTELSTIAFNTFNAIRWFKTGLSPKVGLPDTMGHSGPCKPGVMRLFVTYDGYFYPCEKVDDSSCLMKIGSVDTGFDEERIKQIYNLFYKNDSKCKNCWNILHCNICAKSVIFNDEVSLEMYEAACRDACRNTDNNIKRIIAIQEARERLKSS